MVWDISTPFVWIHERTLFSFWEYDLCFKHLLYNVFYNEFIWIFILWTWRQLVNQCQLSSGSKGKIYKNTRLSSLLCCCMSHNTLTILNQHFACFFIIIMHAGFINWEITWHICHFKNAFIHLQEVKYSICFPLYKFYPKILVHGHIMHQLTICITLNVWSF